MKWYIVMLALGVGVIGLMMISTDNGIFVNKAYRELPKLVGMIGS